jgi:hypothetical protein
MLMLKEGERDQVESIHELIKENLTWICGCLISVLIPEELGSQYQHLTIEESSRYPEQAVAALR